VRSLYRAAHVYTLAHPTTGEWLLVDDRHVQRVGAGDPPGADRVVDLPGATILPGFVDTHVHLTDTGESLANEDIRLARSGAELLKLARVRAETASGTGPIVVSGFDETKWGDPTTPTLAELDAVTPRPLAVRRADGHVALANGAAIAAADLSGTRGVERDDDGGLTGRLTQAAVQALDRWLAARRSDHEVQELQLKGASLAAARGVTSIHEMSLPHELGIRDLQVFLGQRASLPVDGTAVVATMDIPQVMDLGLSSIGGDLPVDGSIGARTAHLSDPYADGDGSGVAYYIDDELAGFFHDGHAAGLQVGVHAIGDAAIEQVLTVWERVYQALDSRERRHFRARRHRIEHFEMASANQVERAAMLGLAVSVQPAFDLCWGGTGELYERRLGVQRSIPMNPFRSMLERGVEVGAGSDAPVTPLDPMMAITGFERHHDPDQRLSRFEAIRVHTVGGARLAHREEKKGALRPGMHADFAAYDDDPFEADTVQGLRPMLTVSLGREVFAA
jgi:predicted amidohydrolase YtcJ